ncbi:MAG: riboflavin synthase [Dehalococcoidia bacterium]|nr:MAG: riboflavin synthase [Dehalococcoidia bacterium]
MFTGIVEEIGQVAALNGHRLTVRAHKVLKGIETGGSIAVNGTCLTVTEFDTDSFTVDIMEETLKRTNLGILKAGDFINLEGALTLSKGLGGHLVQGHVDATGRVKSVAQLDKSTLITITASPQVMRYIVEKGFVAVDGISLTVVERTESTFCVSIIGFTRENTTLGQIKVGDIVNLEADIIAKYVEQFVAGPKNGISRDFLKEHGFLTG